MSSNEINTKKYFVWCSPRVGRVCSRKICFLNIGEENTWGVDGVGRVTFCDLPLAFLAVVALKAGENQLN